MRHLKTESIVKVAPNTQKELRKQKSKPESKQLWYENKSLKKSSIEKCFSLLKEFIDDAQVLKDKKGIAVLALAQLRRVTAGIGDEGNTDESDGSGCFDKPRIYGAPGNV